MQGAGHNFGVVIEATIKIYDVPFGTARAKWTYEQFIFRDDGNTLEKVFEVASELLDSQPAEYTHFVPEWAKLVLFLLAFSLYGYCIKRAWKVARFIKRIKRRMRRNSGNHTTLTK